MTEREEEILDIISKNPLIGQKELAELLGITRSSVGVHVTNLMKKGYITGRGYIVNKKPYICVVGGVNVDIQGFPYGALRPKDSNPGKAMISLGGVGRNIAENLCRMGIKTSLISTLGDDIYGKKVLEEARAIGLNMQDSLILPNEATSSYLSILDETGDMSVAISSMDIYENMTVEFIQEKKNVIENASLCIVDTNIPKEVIEYLVINHRDTDYFLDTVSTTKAMKVKDIIGYFHTIKPNKLEAEMLSGIEITGEEDIKRVLDYFLNKGVKRVFLSMGAEGVYYCDNKNFAHISSPNVKVVNATGAGDAFVAGAAYGYYNHMDINRTAFFSMAASIMALQHKNTINPNISVDNINKIVKEIEIC